MRSRRTLFFVGGAAAVASLALSAQVESAPDAAEASATAEARPVTPRAVAGVAAEAERPSVATATPQVAAPYWEGELLVAPSAGSSMSQVAARVGGAVVREVGRSGFGLVRLPEGTSVAHASAQLTRAGLISRASANGAMVGAGKSKTPQVRGPKRFQWHKKASRSRAANTSDPADYTEWVVAVLDTGVAYEDHTDDSFEYAAAGTLADNPIVAAYDFVNNDEHANDDHQHGTHIASIIASQDDGAIEGQVEGMAPGVGLMPLKVLDENNSGSEYALVEAIYHAVDHEADVINMSLSFHPDYVPSIALNEAIEAANRAGILMVAASGNDGLGAATWPAASPLVIGVGSGSPDNDNNEMHPSEYSNLAASVDIVAAGGDLDADNNDDGQIDGILGQTIRLNQPDDMGYWFYAGTSQAAAVVSGALVQLLEAGATPSMARNALLMSAQDDVGDKFASGTGAGSLNIDAALEMVEDDDDALYLNPRYHVAVMPVLYAKSATEVVPVASVTVLDDAGEPAPDVTAWVSFGGAVTGMSACTTDDAGWCYAPATTVEWVDEDTMEQSAVAVSVEVATVVSPDDIPVHPTPLIYVQGQLELMLAGMETEPELDGAALTIHWTPTVEDKILERISGAYTVLNTGTGLASSPMGLVFNQPAIDSFASTTSFDVDLDGTGLASSPMGMMTFDRLTFDGTGLASSPMGLMGLRLAAFDGTGLASSPMGFTAWHMVMTIDALDGSGLASSPMGLQIGRLPIMVDLDGTGLASSPMGMTALNGTRIGDLLATGGTMTGTGHPVAEAIRASGVAGVGPVELVEDPTGQGATEADISDMYDN